MKTRAREAASHGQGSAAWGIHGTEIQPEPVSMGEYLEFQILWDALGAREGTENSGLGNPKVWDAGKVDGRLSEERENNVRGEDGSLRARLVDLGVVCVIVLWPPELNLFTQNSFHPKIHLHPGFFHL